MNRFCRLLVLALCLSVSTIASASYDFESDGIYYKVISLENMTVGVTSGNEKYNGRIEIPASVTYNGKTFTVTQILKDAFAQTAITEIKLPSTLRIIGTYAFSTTSKLTGIDLPTEQPLKLEGHAFYHSALESIIIPDNVTEMGQGVFNYCQSLVSAEIGTGLTVIPLSAFSQSTNLKTIKIGANVQSIGSKAFSSCKNLSEINLPDGLKSIGESAFWGCKRITAINLPAGLETIPSSVFCNCERLEEVTIPDNVLTVEHQAFYGCTRLKKITFGSKVEEIENSNFSQCPALTEIAIRNPEPPVCPAFENKQYMDIALRVPADAIDDYKKAQPWKDFWDINAIGTLSSPAIASDSDIHIQNGAIIVSEAVADNGIQVYDITGKCVYTGHETVISGLPKGIYILKHSSATIKIQL